MSQAFPRSSRIIGTGSYFPDKVLSNADLEKIVETSDEWIRTRTGISTRRMVAPDQACSDLAYNASVRAMEMAGITATDLDGIFVGTISGDMQFPATATLLQDRLGASNAVAMDLSAACSGFLFGTNVAHGMIMSGMMNRVLVVGAEVLTKFVDWTDRATCVLFGDAAGAAILESAPAGEGILATCMHSDGSLADLLCIPGGGSRKPFGPESLTDHSQFIKMKGDGVFKWAVRAMADAAREVVETAGYQMSDVKVFVPHQANIRIIDAVVERLEVPMDRVVINLDRYGNTSSATIPTALDEVVRNGRIQRDDLVVLSAFGAGFTWGSVLFRHSIGP